VRPNQRSLNFELAFMSTEFRPNMLEILAAVSVIKRAEGHDSRHATRFINLTTGIFGPFHADLRRRFLGRFNWSHDVANEKDGKERGGGE
jgi:hypothetical protein